MDIHEMNFISFLFNDDRIQTLFKGNTITFIDGGDDNMFLFSIVYPGNMRKFLEQIAGLNISDNTALCNMPTAAKSALYFIK